MPINHDWLIRFNCAQTDREESWTSVRSNVNGINIRHTKWIRSGGSAVYADRLPLFRGFKVASVCMCVCVSTRAPVYAKPVKCSCAADSIQKHVTRWHLCVYSLAYSAMNLFIRSWNCPELTRNSHVHICLWHDPGEGRVGHVVPYIPVTGSQLFFCQKRSMRA